jgi:hypothetical protein
MPPTQNKSGVVIEDLLTKIQTSQNAEKKLVTQLDALTSASGYTINNEIQSIVDSINSLSNSRIAMFSSIGDKADILQAGVSNSRTDLVSQMTLLGVVEDQLTQYKHTLDGLQSSNDTKMRLVEVNTYYGKRYAAQGKLMKLVILICVPVLILFILKRKGLLPELISNYAIGITIAVGAFFVIRNAWDISTRSNMNFDEYEWNYEDPSSQTPTVWEYNKANMFNLENPLKALMSNLGLCVGSNCCANGMYFDTNKQLCTTKLPAGTDVASSVAKASVVTENFMCGNTLNGTAVSKFDKDEEKQNGISPYSYSNDFAWIQ